MKNRKKKIGFTLIELLAVIIVLAIIALIATPIIFNVIENAKLKSLENSCYGVIDAVRTKYAEGLLNSIDGTVKLKGNVTEITVSGEQPIEGIWEIDNSSDSNNRGIKIKDVKFGSMKDYTCTNVNSDGTVNSKVTCTKGEDSEEKLPEEFSYEPGLYNSNTKTQIIDWDELINLGVWEVKNDTFKYVKNFSEDEYNTMMAKILQNYPNIINANMIVLKDGIKKVGYMFEENAFALTFPTMIEHIVLPNSVNYIEKGTFIGSKVTELVFKGTISQWNNITKLGNEINDWEFSYAWNCTLTDYQCAKNYINKITCSDGSINIEPYVKTGLINGEYSSKTSILWNELVYDKMWKELINEKYLVFEDGILSAGEKVNDLSGLLILPGDIITNIKENTFNNANKLDVVVILTSGNNNCNNITKGNNWLPSSIKYACGNISDENIILP